MKNFLAVLLCCAVPVNAITLPEALEKCIVHSTDMRRLQEARQSGRSTYDVLIGWAGHPTDKLQQEIRAAQVFLVLSYEETDPPTTVELLERAMCLRLTLK